MNIEFGDDFPTLPGLLFLVDGTMTEDNGKCGQGVPDKGVENATEV